MTFKDLRDFIAQLEQRGALKRIQVPISPVLEMTEVCDRTLRAKGPALLFEKPTGFDMPVLGNLFGTPERVALGMGAEDVGALREIGKLLAQLKELLCDGLDCFAERDGWSLYMDNNHLSTQGAHELGPLFEPMLQSLDDSRIASQQ